MFSPAVWRSRNIKQELTEEPHIIPDETQENNEKMIESGDESDDSSESGSEDEIERIKYRRTYKDFVNQKGERASPVVAADYNSKLRLIACAHENGVFALFEMNWAADASEYGSLIQVQRLTMENSSGISRLIIAPKGDWLALGGEGGQLIVWEWASQSYIMQQQCQVRVLHL